MIPTSATRLKVMHTRCSSESGDFLLFDMQICWLCSSLRNDKTAYEWVRASHVNSLFSTFHRRRVRQQARENIPKWSSIFVVSGLVLVWLICLLLYHNSKNKLIRSLYSFNVERLRHWLVVQSMAKLLEEAFLDRVLDSSDLAGQLRVAGGDADRNDRSGDIASPAESSFRWNKDVGNVLRHDGERKVQTWK